MDSLYQLLRDKPVVIPSVLLRNYRKIGLTTDEFMLFMQYNLYGNDFERIAKHMGVDKQEVKTLLTQLVERQYVQMTYQPDDSGKLDIFYSFDPIYERLTQLLKNQDKSNGSQQSKGDVFSFVETEFSRALSPVEMERIEQWLVTDNLPVDVIKLAVSEAVLANALNIKYIDRILYTWQKQGVKTLEQAKSYMQLYRQSKDEANEPVAVDAKEADLLMRNFLR